LIGVKFDYERRRAGRSNPSPCQRAKRCQEAQTLIESELQSAGRFLYEIASSLKHISGSAYDNPQGIIPLIEKAPEICGLGRIRTMLAELSALQETLSQLNRSATELGLD
jgi:hypothetical protein